MTRNRKSWGWFSALGSWLAIASCFDCALAQITPDSTLGSESSVVTPANINGLPTDQIDGGATRGANLFHSFDAFSVPTGGAAFFNNAPDIQNIISRVTGASISNIDGLLRANPNANLFLLNPNGIIFGPNASLNIGGSFVGSTASSLNFADGSQFSAQAPQTTPLLTVSVPLGLQFGGTAEDIRVQGSSLEMQPGKTLALMGGNVRLDGGRLQTQGGQVELGGVAGAGTLGLQVDGENLGLSFPSVGQFADVSLTNGAQVNVRAEDGGSIALNARNLYVSAGSKLLAGRIASDLGSIDTQAGDITLNAKEAIAIANDSVIANEVLPGAVGKGGNINIMAGSLSVTNGSQLRASTSGKGDGGSVNIHAGSTVSFDGVGSDGRSSAAVTPVEEEASGNGGQINITAGSLFVTNGAQLGASTRGWGNAGSVNIHAGSTVSFDGVNSNRGSGAFSLVADTGVGNGGEINITAESLSVTNGAQLVANTTGWGNAGSVNIHAGSTVSFDGVNSNGGGSGAFSSVTLGEDNVAAVGNGGSINITAGSLSVTNGAQLSASTYGQGDAGSVNIDARDTVSFDGTRNERPSGASSSVAKNASGNGGGINIKAGSLSVTNGAQVSTSTYGQGDAGSVTILARDNVSFDGVGSNGFPSGAGSIVGAEAVGDGGGIDVTTGSLSVTNGARLSASNTGTGAAGDIEVSASSIRLDNKAFLSSNTTAGQGNIILRSQDLVLRRGSNITTDATGTATGGNIIIDTGVLAALENSDISANASEGTGGRVRINAQGIFGTEFREDDTPQSDITASSDLGPQFSGIVEINTLDIDPSRGLVNLPTQPIDTEVVQACQPGGSEQQSEFIITGRGGLPPNPGDALSTDAVMVDLITLNPEVEQPSSPPVSANPTSPAPTQIVEAQGWVINNKGEVVLTATAPTVTPHNPWMVPANCHRS